MTAGAARGQGCLGHMVLSPEGRLDGWCWYPDAPTERAIVDIVVDGRTALSIKATLSRGDLRDLSMGDGFNGFSVPRPAAATVEGAIIEARDRRRRYVFSRIVQGVPAAERQMRRRMDRLAGTLDTTLSRTRNVAGSLGPALADLGRLLQAGGRGDPAETRGEASPAGLVAALDWVSAIPALDLGVAASPRVCVALPADLPVADIASAIRHAAVCLRGIPSEFLLVTDQRLPLGSLLPTRLRGLKLVEVGGSLSGPGAHNEVALSARAEWIAFVDDPRRLNGFALCEALVGASEGRVYLGSPVLALVGDHMTRWDARIETRPYRSGLDCLVSRRALLEASGFEAMVGEPPAAMWVRFVDRLRALGAGVVGWREPRAFGLSGADAWEVRGA